VLKMIFLIHF